MMRRTQRRERNACVAAAPAKVGQSGNGTREGEVVRKGSDRKRVRTIDKRILWEYVSALRTIKFKGKILRVDSPNNNNDDWNLVKC